ncbi:hypothetical protein RJ639_015592 [Escallonia herrerae]|uniref:Uncharacterized protein n=1 Tax=Escallonia herrerae TaxID=1293975 RepID=A0AA89AK53_9ASTE|nr:hypothetical protein RJ639_015592 [Escallonia herrerae]
MVTLKYSGFSGFREHILRMNDMTSQLKGFDMEISEGFLVHLIMTSLPTQFGLFKINYNTEKEKWKMSELISICVQKEERLKSEQPDSAHVAITGPSKGKGKKFVKGSVQGNKSASITKTNKVGVPLPHIEDNNAAEVVPNDVLPIMDPAPIPTNSNLFGVSCVCGYGRTNGVLVVASTDVGGKSQHCPVVASVNPVVVTNLHRSRSGDVGDSYGNRSN